MRANIEIVANPCYAKAEGLKECSLQTVGASLQHHAAKGVHTMKTIVGLFDDPEAARQATDQFVHAGFAPASVQMVKSVRAIWQHLGCTPGRIVAVDFAIGAALGVGLYGLFAIIVAMGEVALGFDQSIATGAALLFAFLGVLVGGVLGAAFGIASAEEETRLYRNGIRRGGVLFIVRTADEHAERALDMLAATSAEGVKICRRTSDGVQRWGHSPTSA